MTGIERLRRIARSQNMDNVWTAMLAHELCDIADQIERDRACDADTIENLRLELGEARDEAAWVRERGGLDTVKKLLDWVVGHCSTKQQLDFDFWLSGRVMHELGFEEDMADRDEVERRLLARLMPEGMEWPKVDGKPVDFVTGYEPSLGVLEAVSIYNNGACEVMSHDGIVKSAMEIHIAAPKVLDADGVEIRVGERVRSKWSHDGWWYVVTRVESPGKISLKAVKDGSETVLNAANLTHRDSVFDADGEPCEVGDAVWWTRNLAGSFRIIRIEQDGKCAIRDDDPDEPCGMTVPAGQLTHRAPVIAADGRPLREGETVWDANGDELVIGAIEDGGHTVTCRYVDVGDAIPVHGMWSPSDLTHERPVADTWERLEEDAKLSLCEYNLRHKPAVGDGTTLGEDVRVDLVRRAKKLAGVGE